MSKFHPISAWPDDIPYTNDIKFASFDITNMYTQHYQH